MVSVLGWILVSLTSSVMMVYVLVNPYVARHHPYLHHYSLVILLLHPYLHRYSQVILLLPHQVFSYPASAASSARIYPALHSLVMSV